MHTRLRFQVSKRDMPQIKQPLYYASTYENYASSAALVVVSLRCDLSGGGVEDGDA